VAVAQMDLLGPRADEAHLAADDVDLLQQLVEAGAAEDAAEAGDARIARSLDVVVRRRVDTHGSELEEAEQAAALAKAVLPDEGGAGRLGAHRQRQEREQGRGEDEGGHGDEEVERSLGQPRPARKQRRPDHGAAGGQVIPARAMA
jgi:hypothetical protein